MQPSERAHTIYYAMVATESIMVAHPIWKNGSFPLQKLWTYANFVCGSSFDQWEFSSHFCRASRTNAQHFFQKTNMILIFWCATPCITFKHVYCLCTNISFVYFIAATAFDRVIANFTRMDLITNPSRICMLYELRICMYQ